MNIWISSDHHFAHHNIIRYTNRPFSSVDEMNEILIQYWNECVKETDSVYYLGDLALTKNREKVMSFRNRMNGRWKLFIAGNHDDGSFLEDPFLAEEVFIGSKNRHCRQSNAVMFAPDKFYLSHYPVENWLERRGSYWNLHGHTHSPNSCDPAYPFQIHIGVDSWNYRPAELTQIKQLIDKL